MTPFKAALNACGLTQAQAADLLGTHLTNVKRWCNGEVNPPVSAWNELAARYAAVETAADVLRYQIAPEIMTRADYSTVSATPLYGHGSAMAAGVAILRAIRDS